MEADRIGFGSPSQRVCPSWQGRRDGGAQLRGKSVYWKLFKVGEEAENVPHSRAFEADPIPSHPLWSVRPNLPKFSGRLKTEPSAGAQELKS